MTAAVLIWLFGGCAGSPSPVSNGDSDPSSSSSSSSSSSPSTSSSPSSPPPPIALRIPTETVIPIGRSVRDESAGVLVEVLSAETIAGRMRARMRIVVGVGDHEVDLVLAGPPIDVDGIRVRFVRQNGTGPVFSIDRGSEGWSPRESE